MNENKFKVLISGGGTGGHIFPAVSIANALRENYPNVEIQLAEWKWKKYRLLDIT